MVSDKGTKCPKCGTPIQKTEEAVKPIEKEKKVIAMVESLKDDNPISDSSSLETNVHNEAFSEPQSSKKGKIVLLCSIVVIAAIIGVYFLWNSKVMAAYEKQDKPIYSEELVKYAESGDAVAQCDLGVCYANGSGIAKDSYEAFKWFKLSAEQGYARGMRNLGTCYVEGLGVEKNEKEGIKLYKLSAEKGDEGAMCCLGICFYNGYGVSQDYGEAVEWLKKAAEKGDEIAMYNYGLCYYKGDGVSQDYGEAVKWWKKAAEKGHDGAKEALRNMDY